MTSQALDSVEKTEQGLHSLGWGYIPLEKSGLQLGTAAWYRGPLRKPGGCCGS